MSKLRTVGLPSAPVSEDRQVLVHFGDNPGIDRATGAFVGDWHALGLEPQDSSHSHTREVTTNTTNLTAGQSDTSYTTGAITGAVDGIPGSPVMRYIENPAASVVDGVTIGAHTAEVARAYVAFVHKFKSGLVHTWVSREKAELVINERAVSRDPQARPVAITYNNGDDEHYYEENFYMVGESGSVAVEPKIFKNFDDLEQQITAGTAFYPSVTGSDMTAMVPREVDAGDATLQEYDDVTNEGTGETGGGETGA